MAIASLVTALAVPQAFASPPLFLAATATLEKIRVADHKKYQRVVIDTSDAVTFTIVEGETGLVLTLNGIASDSRKWAYSDLGRVKGIRLTPLSETSVNITFDLTGRVRPRIFTYTPDSYGGHRIVIDLWPGKDNVPHVTDVAAPVPELKTEPELQEIRESQATDIPGLKEVQQWPIKVDETATALTPQDAVRVFPDRPAPELDVETVLGEKPEAGGIMNAVVTTDPLASARERMARGAPEEACKVLQVNFPKGTWNIEAMVLQGECLRALGNLTEANILYTEVLSYEPDSVDARIGLADIQARNADFAAARDNYIRALAQLPPGDRADKVRVSLQKVEDQIIKHSVN